MAEHLLHAAQVGAGGEQVRGERVTEGVGAGAAEEVGAPQGPAEDVVQSLPGQRRAPRVQQQLVAAAAAQERAAPVPGVPPHGVRGRRPERDDALLVALAEAAHEAALEVDVGLAQPDELRGAQAAAVEQLEGGQVALPQRPGGHDPRQHALDLLDRQHARQVLAPLRRPHAVDGVLLEHALADEEAVEAAHGGEAPGDGGARPGAPRAGEERLDVVLPRASHGDPALA